MTTVSTLIDDRMEELDAQIALHQDRSNPWRANPERVRIIYGEGRYVDVANGEVDGTPVSELPMDRYLEVMESNRELAQQFEQEPGYHQALSEAKRQVTHSQGMVEGLSQERTRTADYRNQLPGLAQNLATMYEALEDPDVRAELERTGRLDAVLESAPTVEDFEPAGTPEQRPPQASTDGQRPSLRLPEIGKRRR